MIFAKPESGFLWKERERAAVQISNICGNDSSFDAEWGSIKGALIHNGARMGQRAIMRECGFRAINLSTDQRHYSVLYQLHGESIIIHSVICLDSALG